MLEFYLSLIENQEDKDKVIYLYNNYYSYMIYSATKIMTNNTSDVEDVVHDAMISIIDHLGMIDFDDKTKIRNFCGIVARNKAIDYCRKRDNRNVHIEDSFAEPASNTDDPEIIVINRDVYNVVLKAINNLDETYRDACLLKYVNELKDREIADILNLPLRTVNTRIYRGKKLIREALRKENFDV